MRCLLKAGYAVVLKNGIRGIVTPFYDEKSGSEKLVICVEIGGGYEVSQYDEYLRYPIYHEIDISTVLGLSSNPILALSFTDFADRSVLWTREVCGVQNETE